MNTPEPGYWKQEKEASKEIGRLALQERDMTSGTLSPDVPWSDGGGGNMTTNAL